MTDLTGKKYGRLTVLENLGNNIWLCQCSCANKTLKKIMGNNLRAKGGTVSCGCLKIERLVKLQKKNWEPKEIDESTFGIPLSKDQIALIDKDDYDKIKDYGWCASYVEKLNTFYAMTEKYDKRILMHRLIMGVNSNTDIDVDHIDHNTLNNRKSNLRLCNKTQNNMNRCKHKDNRTGFKGVILTKEGRYKAGITFNNKHIHLGNFDTAEEASTIYNKTAKELHGEFYYEDDPKGEDD